MVLTSTSFNKNNYKDSLNNLNSIYGKSNLDVNFKTFYKGEKYNYDIDMNFMNKKSSSPDDSEERRNREKFGLTKNTFSNVNIYKDSDYFDNKDSKFGYGNKKKKILEKKFKANNVIYEESYQDKYISPNKLENVKLNNNYSYQKQNFNNIQLPSLGHKGFNFKKIK